MDLFAKLSANVNWMLIVLSILTLALSVLAFLLVIWTRKRVRGSEVIVQQIAEAVNNLSSNIQMAMELASKAAAAATESARAAKESASASKDCIGTLNRMAELLGSGSNERRMLDKGEKNG